MTPIPANPATQPGAATERGPGSIEQGSEHAAQLHQKLGPQRIPRWLERLELVVRTLLRIYIGFALLLVPWATSLPAWPFGWMRIFWDQNPLFSRFPELWVYAASGGVRGIISGLGLLNLWIALRDAIRNRDG